MLMLNAKMHPDRGNASAPLILGPQNKTRALILLEMYRLYWNGHWWSVFLTGITRPLANALTGVKKIAGAAAPAFRNTEFTAAAALWSESRPLPNEQTLSRLLQIDSNSYLYLPQPFQAFAFYSLALEEERSLERLGSKSRFSPCMPFLHSCQSIQ